MKQPEIEYEDDDICVIVKPQGMPSASDQTMDLDCESWLKGREAENGIPADRVFAAAVHRLDKPVGGLMVLAKNSGAAADLSRQVQERTVDKYYQAILQGHLPDYEGTLDDMLMWDPAGGKSRVLKGSQSGGRTAKEAVLHYEVLDELDTESGHFSYVLIQLKTGRHHQIRCQMAAHGAPVYGDQKYNPKQKRKMPIGLIATRLEFEHPSTGEHMVFKIDPFGPAFDVLDAEEI